MSRSNPSTELVSPCKFHFEWNGDEGGFKYFDKEKEKVAKGMGKIQVPYPFRFMVLDQLTCIKGYNDDEKSGYWSNEIRDTKKELLTVRTKKGIEMTGLYEQVKEKLGAKGADYCKSVYIGFYDDKKKLILGNISMKGAAIGSWIEFCKDNKVMEIGVTVKSHTEAKKGKIIYQIPKFEALKITEEANAAAMELDKELQAYLTLYFEKNKTTEAAPVATPVTSAVEATGRATKATPAHTLDVLDELLGEKETIEEEDDLPF